MTPDISLLATSFFTHSILWWVSVAFSASWWSDGQWERENAAQCKNTNTQLHWFIRRLFPCSNLCFCLPVSLQLYARQYQRHRWFLTRSLLISLPFSYFHLIKNNYLPREIRFILFYFPTLTCYLALTGTRDLCHLSPSLTRSPTWFISQSVHGPRGPFCHHYWAPAPGHFKDTKRHLLWLHISKLKSQEGQLGVCRRKSQKPASLIKCNRQKEKILLKRVFICVPRVAALFAQNFDMLR